MPINRRRLLQLGASAIALSAVGGGLWVQSRRLKSELITGPWEDLGPGAFWLLPDLDQALMVVPDRPHSHEEALSGEVERRRRFRVSTNSQRLRGPAFEPKPAAGVTRIIAIGDSVTFGWGVTREQSWPTLLETRLNALGHRVEVLNAGVPAQRPEVMAGWLQKVGASYGASLVLFCRRPPGEAFDPYLGSLRQAQAALGDTPMHLLLPPISRFDPFGRGRWQWEEQQIRARLDLPVLELTGALWDAQGERGYDLRDADGRFQVLHRSTGAVELDVARSERDLPREIYQLFDDRPEVREALFFDSGHPDAEGFQVFVDAVVQHLQTTGALG